MVVTKSITLTKKGTSMFKNNEYKFVVVIFFMAIAARLLWYLFFSAYVPNSLGGTNWESFPSEQDLGVSGLVSPDFNQVYDPAALMILEGKGFADRDGNLTAYVGPGYSFFLAMVYSINGPDLNLVRLIQIFLDSLIAVMIFFLAKKIYSTRIGVLSGLLYSLYPLAIYQSVLLLTDGLFTFLLAVYMSLSVHFLLKLERKHLVKTSFFISGVVLGLASLVRPNGMVMIASIVLFVLFTSAENRRQLSIAIFYTGIGFALSLSPWIVRNYYVFDQFIPVSSIVFHTFEESEGEIQKNLTEYFVKRISRLFQNTSEVAGSFFTRPFTVWFSTSSGRLDILVAIIQLPILIIAIFGSFVRAQNNNLKIFMILNIIIFVVALLLVSKNALARYIVPIMPFVLILLATKLEYFLFKLRLLKGEHE